MLIKCSAYTKMFLNCIILLRQWQLALIYFRNVQVVSGDSDVCGIKFYNYQVYQMARPEVYNYTVLKGTTFQPVHLNAMPAMFK